MTAHERMEDQLPVFAKVHRVAINSLHVSTLSISEKHTQAYALRIIIVIIATGLVSVYKGGIHDDRLVEESV